MMKKHISFVLLSCAMSISPAHAGSPDIGAGEADLSHLESRALTAASDFAARNVEINVLAAAKNKFDENVALINQIDVPGHATFASVNQSGGSGNFAAIMQDGRVNSASAMILQVGSGNRAIINQH